MHKLIINYFTLMILLKGKEDISRKTKHHPKNLSLEKTIYSFWI